MLPLTVVLSLSLSTLQEPFEWSRAEAQKHWSPMVHPVQHVGAPGFNFQTAVMWDGSLVFGPLGFRNLEVMKHEVAQFASEPMHVSFLYGKTPQLVDRLASRNPLVTRRLSDGFLPIPIVETADGEFLWTETVCAYLLARPLSGCPSPTQQDNLITQVQLTAKNSASTAATRSVWIHFGTDSQVSLGYKVWQGTTLSPSIDCKFSHKIATQQDQLRFAVQEPEKGTLVWHNDTGMLEWQLHLKPKESADAVLLLPYRLVPRTQANELLLLDASQQLQKVKDFWRKVASKGAQIKTGDPWINDYLKAITGNMAQQVAYRQARNIWMYKTSPNHYEGYWPCNAAKALPVFDFRGLAKLNEKVLSGFIKSQTDDVGGLAREGMGSGKELQGEGYAKIPGFLGNFGEWTANPLTLSHGLGMWALARHYRVMRDDNWLRKGSPSPLTTMISAFQWVAEQRKRTKREIDGKKVPYWGLLPAASAHDWLAGNAMFNDGFCIYGMAEVVRLLNEIGDPSARNYKSELTDYRNCLKTAYKRASADASTMPLPDGSLLPFVPRVAQELDWRNVDWTYTMLGPLRDGGWGALEPNDPLVDLALKFCEIGMPKGEGAYYGDQVMNAENGDRNFVDISRRDADRHYLWRHYVEYETMWPVGWQLFLARDDLPRFFEWYANNLGFVVHQDWRVGVESVDGVPSCAPGDGERWQSIRAMFVNERGGFDGTTESLWLCQALPLEWLKPGAKLSVKNMGTVFGGNIDLSVDVSKNGKVTTIRADWQGFRSVPHKTLLRIRQPFGVKAKKVTVNGVPANLLPGNLIELATADNGSYTIKASS